MEYFDNTVKTHEDVERHIRLPFLGLIPFFPSWDKRETKILPSKEIITIANRKSFTLEAYCNIRTSILYATSNKPPKVIVLTSTIPGEGKTTTAMNIALSLIQTGGKVLIIDGDMRKITDCP